MKKLEQFLQNFGLTVTEITLYLSLLTFRHATVRELAEKTGLKRPRIYHALDTLEEEGLVRQLSKGKILRYKAESPEQLQLLLKRKKSKLKSLQKKLDKMLPLFPSIETRLGIPEVEFFRGKEGIINMAERSTYQNKKKELFVIAPSNKVIETTFPLEYIEYYAEEKVKEKINTKSIWNDQLDHSIFADHKKFNREVRIAPKHMRNMYRSMILLWDKHVAIITPLPELFGVLITSPDYFCTMKAIWDVVWSVSRPINCKKKNTPSR